MSPTDIIKALECDFADQSVDDNPISQEDLLFLSKVKAGITHKEDGHYEISLPFKTDKPHLLDNKQHAVQRLASLEQRLKRNEQYYTDYVIFMNDIIARGDVEKGSTGRAHEPTSMVHPTSRCVSSPQTR